MTDAKASFAVLGPGELLGELSLFDPGPRTATATALTETSLMGLGHNALRPWLTGRPEVAEALLQALALRLRRTNEQMADLVFSDVPGRVAKTLLELGEKFGRPLPDGIHVTHDMTQEELAQLVGASRETVNKALADFAARGWIRLESRSVILIDPERLDRRSSNTRTIRALLGIPIAPAHWSSASGQTDFGTSAYTASTTRCARS